MSHKQRIYRCPICDTTVETVQKLGVELTCCGPAMVRVGEKNAQQCSSSHRLKVEVTLDGVKVGVGDSSHPMRTHHHIAWIELVSKDKRCRQFLQPGQPAEAVFPLTFAPVSVRALCSSHGLFKLAVASASIRDSRPNALAA